MASGRQRRRKRERALRHQALARTKDRRTTFEKRGEIRGEVPFPAELTTRRIRVRRSEDG